jgi:hypothetical protein
LFKAKQEALNEEIETDGPLLFPIVTAADALHPLALVTVTW